MTEQPESTVPADTASTDPELSAHELNDQMAVRAAKRQAAQDAGMAPYPVDVHRTTTLAAVREQFGQLEPGEETEHVVTVAGRVVHVRNTGKLCFATLQEGDGTRLQAMLSKVIVGDEPLAQWKALVDLGDFVAITGRVISSRRGELSVMADSWTLASKALRPLPTMHKELNEETRVRQRYLDLIVRQEARDVVLTRSTITRTVRRVMEEQGYVEIETPTVSYTHLRAHETM